jgi:hypothetical protein
MQQGELRVIVSLDAEPQKLATYWRGSLRDTIPTSASITLLRENRRPRNDWWWDYRSPHIGLEAMTRTEKKRAELSISDLALHMSAGEIATARELTDMTFKWLSGRGGIPEINKPIPQTILSVVAEGNELLLPIIEKFSDPELLSRVVAGAVYLQGEPRRPDVRWLPPMTDSDKAKAIAEIPNFEKLLADDQGQRLRDVVETAARLFRKKRAARRALITKRYFALFGMGGEVSFVDRPVTDEMLEDYEYEKLIAWLEVEERERARARARRVP